MFSISLFWFVCVYVWFPIRGSCLSLSLIGDHTEAAVYRCLWLGFILRQLSIVVSDWVSHISCPFSFLGLVGSCFLFNVGTWQNCVLSFSLLFECFLKIKIMNTFHAALWSTPFDESRYKDACIFGDWVYWYTMQSIINFTKLKGIFNVCFFSPIYQ